MSTAGRIVRFAVDPWLGFFALVLAAWAALFATSAELARATGAPALGPGMPTLASFAGALGEPSVLPVWHAHAGLASTVGMWCLMSLAMMAPTAVPMLRTYRHIVEGRDAYSLRAGFPALLAGYIAVWALFSVCAGAAQHALTFIGAVSDAGLSRDPWLTVGLLASAGLYQFSSLKQACLRRCRSPMAFLLSHWRPGVRGAVSMGLRHGVDCVGCCWALMALAFVGGTMNLVWMGAAMTLMVIEKLPVGRRLTAPLGVVLIAAAGFVAVASLSGS